MIWSDTQERPARSTMRKIPRMWLFASLLILVISWPIGLVHATGSSVDRLDSTKIEADVLKIIETEVWDTDSRSWKALSGEQRWSNERGQVSSAPSDAQPPFNCDFDGEWKIVISGSDALGWEYTFQYLQAPNRKRVWLRSLKARPHTKLAPAPKRRNGIISKALAEMRDGYNFKGFSLKLYKSLLSLQGLGLGVSIPMTMNFDLWDRNPWLPSISSTLGLYYPLTLTAALSASIHVAWLKWFLKTIILFLPQLLILLFHKFALQAMWVAATAALMPLGLRMPPIPQTPIVTISNPKYQSGISERVGCSLSYRWSKRRGIEWRFNYWHSYLPTFTVYRKLFGMDAPSDWWDKHFGSLGLSSGYPLPLPPHYSCSLCLGLSGLYFKSKNPVVLPPVAKEDVDRETKISVSTALKEFATNSTDTLEIATHPHQEQPLQAEAFKAKPAKLVVGSKAS